LAKQWPPALLAVFFQKKRIYWQKKMAHRISPVNSPDGLSLVKVDAGCMLQPDYLSGQHLSREFIG
jgi:hypothetical protein